jgi:GTPase SAR1 family protein
MKYAQFVMGPAGCGKSTYCATIQEHFRVSLRRECRVVNLDPAAESFAYDCELDVRELVSVDDVMEELNYGPNGGLVYAMEYIADNMSWLEEQLNEYIDDDYLIFDCPGQIELYSHLSVMREVVDMLQNLDFRVAGVYCLDINFIEDAPKFMAGGLAALTAMVNLELPHINVLTKCDLLKDETDVDKFLEADTEAIICDLKGSMQPKYRNLTEAMGGLLDEYSLVSFVQLNREDEDSIELVLAHVNNCIQYGENLEPTGKFDMADADYDDGDGD